MSCKREQLNSFSLHALTGPVCTTNTQYLYQIPLNQEQEAHVHAPSKASVNWGTRNGLESTSACWGTGDKLGSQDCLLGNSRQDKGGETDGNRRNKWHPACEYIKVSLDSLHCAGDTWTCRAETWTFTEFTWSLLRPRKTHGETVQPQLLSSPPVQLWITNFFVCLYLTCQIILTKVHNWAHEEECSPLCYVTCAAVKHIQALYIYLWFWIDLFLVPSLTWYVTSLFFC